MSDELRCTTCGETYRVTQETHRTLYLRCDCGKTSMRVATTLPGETV